ncbi:MBL fold metallo-hydrolase [Desulfohalovibrio reitneri]|uniref:MBL fold metallo-hydrolase n=1 Tax=Desulfohalovibrio reitneri TaxID=1307759 RepID=UPI0004A6AD31|nr:MBL fold metallo-hydrolase [Desulfohalovibrio reitneri]
MSFFFQPVHSEHLGHISYIFGRDGEAAVVDPRRDCEEYVAIARANGARITYIFETHRNEDYVTGSAELAARTGAEIRHGEDLPFTYGAPTGEDFQFLVGGLRVVSMKTPGHTDESLSYVLYDPESAGREPVGVFTGDVLFVHDTGRTDFFPDRAEEVAGLLYDSIFEKILPLGDHVLLWPAHGAGSVCGSTMAEREVSTLGLERRTNPALKFTKREDFIKKKLAEKHTKPPYFHMMEKYNLHGSAAPMPRVPTPPPLDVDDFAERAENGMRVVDTRSPEAIAGALIPGSLAIPLHMLPAFAGWFLEYERPIGLVVDDAAPDDLARSAMRYLMRLGFDQVEGYITGMSEWEKSGREYDRIPAVHVDELVSRIESDEDFTLLDVRKDEEVAHGMLPDAKHVFLGHLPDRIGELDKSKPAITFCGSGQRAIIAASLLKAEGFKDVGDALGSMAACSARGCPIDRE